MKLNKKGVTLVEIIVSLALTSVVLIFLMTLFINVRGVYNSSRIEADYDMFVSTFIKSIGDDIERYGLLSVEYKEETSNSSEVIFTFNEYRPTKLSQRIMKVLKVYDDKNGIRHIRYGYEVDVTDDIVSAERITNVDREVPEGSFFEDGELIKIRRLEDKAVEIKVPMINSNGTDYTINVYSIIDIPSD